MDGEVISKRIKATESTTLAKLSFLDQFKLLIHRFNNSDAAELDAAEKMSRISLRMQASLQNLFSKATEGLDEGVHDSVTLQVSSKYLPYLDDVIDPRKGMGRYYNFEITKRDLPVTVDFMFIVKISRKVT